jgi:hypothetical protein
MGTFAETAIVDYLIVRRPRKANFRFHLQLTDRSLPFPYFICSKQTEVAVF